MDETLARHVIADHLGVPAALVTDGAALDDLGADPLDVVALVVRMERTFGVRISDADADHCRTVGDVLLAARRGRALEAEASPSAAPAMGCA